MSNKTKSDFDAHSASAKDAGSAEISALACSVQVRVDQLVAGTRLHFPIHDRSGLLLLAHGAQITTHFKELLIARGVLEVMLHEDDAADIASSACSSQKRSKDGLQIPRYGARLTNPLDDMVDARGLSLEQSGPRIKDRLVRHGATGYDRGLRETIARQYLEACSKLGAMITAVEAARLVDGGNVCAIVIEQLASLIQDIDCVLYVAHEAGRSSSLAVRCVNMSLFGMAIAADMGIHETAVRTIGLAGLMHDWGMVRVPKALLDSSRILTRAEFVEIEKHPLHTLELLRYVSAIPDAVPVICYQVHEKNDGRGYPRGRYKAEIHPGARILHVVDAYLGLIASRPYRLALTSYAAISHLLEEAGQQLVDADVVRSLLNVVSMFPIGSYVTLTDGSKARVLRSGGDNFAAPVVQIVQTSKGEPVESQGIITDLSQAKQKIVKALATPGRQEVGRTAADPYGYRE